MSVFLLRSPTRVRPPVDRRVCVYCGVAHPAFQRREVRLVSCPACAGDLYSRPPRSYAQMEGLTPDSLASRVRPGRLRAFAVALRAAFVAAFEFWRLVWVLSARLRAKRRSSPVPPAVRRSAGATSNPPAPRRASPRHPSAHQG